MNFRRCNCGKKAVWMYMPSSTLKNPFYCDDCVPRGCDCNKYFERDFCSPEEYEAFKKGFSNIMEGESSEGAYFEPLDEKNRREPCCEYEYSPDGFEF